MRVSLDIWRQADRTATGGFVRYDVDGLDENMSFLEVLDLLNEQLVTQGHEPVAFDSDCREGILPQGQPERASHVLAMVARMDEEGFGNCTWHGECQAACPKSISIDTIARMNGDWLRASWSRKRSHHEPKEPT